MDGAEPWSVEIEPEVLHWLENLPDRDYYAAEEAVERRCDRPATLGEPYARHLGDGVRELRFAIRHDGIAVRVTYWLAPDQRIVLLTVFRKTKMRESSQVDRARQATRTCRASHDSAPDHAVYTRTP